MARRRTLHRALANDPGTLSVTPHDPSGRLPSWHPRHPPNGWTVEAVAEAARAYADQRAHPGGTEHFTRAAYRALLSELPAVKRTEVEARLRGELAGLAALDSYALNGSATVTVSAPF